MDKVRDFRKKMGLSQLAKSVGVARQIINLIENQKYNPSLDFYIRLAKAFDTDLNTLFWEEQKNDADR